MPKKDHLTLSTGYAVCEHSDSQCAATCLHRIAYAEMVKMDAVLRLLNPTMCVKNESCLRVLHIVGVTAEMQFDSYEELISRYD